MSKLKWQRLIGQERVKEALGAAFENRSFGHAYLFAGTEGVGGLAAALDFSAALLCENKTEAPCNSCESCRQLAGHNHPDFHLVMPLPFAKEHKASDGKLNETGWTFIAESCRAALADPYSTPDAAGMLSMPVEWLRETNHAILRGAVKNGCNVVCITGVDQLGKESANSMLKTLEEPPANTVILLVTERLQAVLPTLVSRCQIVRLGYLGAPVIAAALAALKGVDPADARLPQIAELAAGSFTKARTLLENPDDQNAFQANRIWQWCTQNDWAVIGPELDDMVENTLGNGRDYHTCERILIGLMHIGRTAFLPEDRAGRNYILPTGNRIQTIGPEAAGRLLAACQDAISAIRGWGNMHLTLVTLLFEMTETLHEQKR
jgi:DNA polymerase III delta prime subunit